MSMLIRYFNLAGLPPALRHIVQPICELVRSENHPRMVIELIADHLQDLSADGVVFDPAQMDFAHARLHAAEALLDKTHVVTDEWMQLILEAKDCAVRACRPEQVVLADPDGLEDGVKGCCEAPRMITVSAKVSDRFHMHGDGVDDHDGYVPEGLGIGGGDYIEMTYCLNCGRISGSFPAGLSH